MGAAEIQTVIQMNGPQPLQSDGPVKFRQNAVQIVNDVIPGVGNVAGVQTDAHLPRQLHPIQNLPQFLKASAYLAALPGHGLQQYRCRLFRGQDGVESFRDIGDPGFGPLSHMAAGVEIVKLPRYVLHTAQIVRHGVPCEKTVLFLRAAEIQGVRGMGDDRCEAVILHERHQRRRVRRVQFLGLAPPGIPGEKLKGVRPQFQRLPAHSQKALGG